MSEEHVHVALGDRSYEIVIGEGLLNKATQYIPPVLRGRDVFLVWDENVASPHGKLLFAALSGAGLNVETFQLPAGEQTKCTAQLSALWDRLVELRFGRDCTVIALGGGVVGDLVGFAAASYLRGVDFIQIPTSLLAMVDSSVGGKTGINHPLGKNLIGAFWQPRLVLADTAVLKTLPEGERISALAEIIKYGVIRDASFFGWLEDHIERVRALDPEAIAHAVRRSCELKAEVVAQDEREGGLREILNFGHTIGHAIENAAGYGKLRHGEAIAIGMIAESRIAIERESAWDKPEHERLINLIKRAGLPTELPSDLRGREDELITLTKGDKKARAGKARYAIPTALGAMERVTIEDQEAMSALHKLDNPLQ